MRFTTFLFFLASCLWLRAQSDYLLPFSLQASLGRERMSRLSNESPALDAMYAAPSAQLALSSFCRYAYIKENAHYGLAASLSKGKNHWNFFYDYKGFSLLHQQRAGLAYGRNLLPGLGIGFQTAYRIGNRIEDREPEKRLDIGLSAAFQKDIWSVAVSAHQPLVLHAAQKREWNDALSLHLAGGCRLHKNLHLGLDVYKDLRYPLQGGIGLAWLLKPPQNDRHRFVLYAQARVNPSACKLGLAYLSPHMEVHLGFAYQNPIGFETCASLTLKHTFSKTRDHVR